MVETGEITLDEVAERMRHSDALLLLAATRIPLRDSRGLGKWNPRALKRCRGIREHLAPERGTLIASEDESALAQSLIQWAQHPDQFNPQSLREYAKSTFSVEAVAQAYDDVYREAITRQTTAR